MHYQLLIADDDHAFRDAVRAIFEPFVSLLEAESGEEAIEIVENESIHLVLLDMHMHELTGIETLRIFRSIQIEAPCIIVSADADEQLTREAEQADAWSVLKKPVRKRELVSTVAGALETTYDDPSVSFD